MKTKQSEIDDEIKERILYHFHDKSIYSLGELGSLLCCEGNPVGETRLKRILDAMVIDDILGFSRGPRQERMYSICN